ncbi:MAG: type II secretion system protein [Phycisphaerales bacterium]|nr:MAG: type II secretion system protein [Phycisphaerales bacterium]
MLQTSRPPRCEQRAFTLIELLVVISIIAMLISILLPSLGQAREQAKGVHCLARLKDIGTALAAYENVHSGVLPPARWFPAEAELDRTELGAATVSVVEWGWMEALFGYVYKEEILLPVSYPVQRNIQHDRWEEYFHCESVPGSDVNSGHYRVYLPAWSAGSYVLEADGVYGDATRANPDWSTHRDRLKPKLPIIGDANDLSERGDGLGNDDCSYIDAGEADYAGSDGRSNGNRFADRHYGGTNYLFQDLHARWSAQLRGELARDYDLNGITDIDVGW